MSGERAVAASRTLAAPPASTARERRVRAGRTGWANGSSSIVRPTRVQIHGTFDGKYPQITPSGWIRIV